MIVLGSPGYSERFYVMIDMEYRKWNTFFLHSTIALTWGYFIPTYISIACNNATVKVSIDEVSVLFIL